MYFCADLSERGLALNDFPLALKEPLHAKKVNIKQKCASISCQSHIFETFSILHAIDFWYAPRLPRGRLLSFTPGCWKSSNLNTKNVTWKRTPPPSNTPRKKNPRIFSCEMLEDFKEFFNHPRNTTNRMWHFFQLLHKQVGEASPPLFWDLSTIHFWLYFITDSCVSVSHNSHFKFFLLLVSTLGAFSLFLNAKFHLWNSVPWRLFHKWSLHHWPLSPGAGLHFFVPVLHSQTRSSQSWKQMALINLPITRLVAGHPSVTKGSRLTMSCTETAEIKVSRLHFLANSLDEKSKCHNPQFNIFYKAQTILVLFLFLVCLLAMITFFHYCL